MKKIIYLTFLFSLIFSAPALAAETNKSLPLTPPDLTQPLKDTMQTISSSDLVNILLANKGKFILVNFFATWCEPCLNELPDLVNIRKEYPEDELIIIGLSLDHSVYELEKYLKKNPLNYPIFIPSDGLIGAYRVNSIPHNIIYNKEGKAIYNTSGTITEALIKKILQ